MAKPYRLKLKTDRLRSVCDGGDTYCRTLTAANR
jgi:hypothetical protein